MTSSAPTAAPRAHPALKLSPHASLSPQATLLGTYPITLGPSSVVHPRAKLVAVHGPVTVGEGCVVCERASVGVLDSVEGRGGGGEPTDDMGGAGVVLEKGVMVESGAVVEARMVGEGSVVEVGAKVGKGAVVGKHCKISPLCIIPLYDILPDRTVVYGGEGGGGGGGGGSGGGTGVIYGGEQQQQQRRVEPEALQESRARMLGKHVEVLKTLVGK
ncbi:hypothetical protein MMC07_008293 [Pseudocyphellaria aurata]|nr:hypothetical protein [Pseudocyphellaria aurata]